MDKWPVGILLIGKAGPLPAALHTAFTQEGFTTRLIAPGEPVPATDKPWLWVAVAPCPDEAGALRLPKGNAAQQVVVLSSYQVFSGEKSGFYVETDEPDGDSPAAKTWQALEQQAIAYPNHCILRTDRLFGAEGSNILTRLLRGVLDTGEVHVTNHLRGCPTAESDIVRVIVAMVQQIACGASCQGVYHYCSGDITHCSEFAEAVITHARQFQPVPDVKIIAHDSEASGQRSPLLSCQRILDHFGIRRRAWHSSLPRVMRDYFGRKPETESGSRPQ